MKKEGDKPKKPRKRKAKIEEVIFTPVEVVHPVLELRAQAVMGRPTIYSPALCQAICTRISVGESMRSICRDDDMPALTTVMYWLNDPDKEDFLKQYKGAKDIQADLMAEDIVDIADDSTNDYMMKERGDYYENSLNAENIQRSRLRVDARKWVASKLKPKKYGDKLDVTTDGQKLPTPLLANVSILDNNSNPESPSAE
jgi:hypothetical protein